LFCGSPEEQQVTKTASGGEPVQKLNSEALHAQYIAVEFGIRSPPPLAVLHGQSEITVH